VADLEAEAKRIAAEKAAARRLRPKISRPRRARPWPGKKKAAAKGEEAAKPKEEVQPDG